MDLHFGGGGYNLISNNFNFEKLSSRKCVSNLNQKSTTANKKHFKNSK